MFGNAPWLDGQIVSLILQAAQRNSHASISEVVATTKFQLYITLFAKGTGALRARFPDEFDAICTQ